MSLESKVDKYFCCTFLSFVKNINYGFFVCNMTLVMIIIMKHNFYINMSKSKFFYPSIAKLNVHKLKN